MIGQIFDRKNKKIGAPAPIFLRGGQKILFCSLQKERNRVKYKKYGTSEVAYGGAEV